MFNLFHWQIEDTFGEGKGGLLNVGRIPFDIFWALHQLQEKMQMTFK
jgi:hypothetical protein